MGLLGWIWYPGILWEPEILPVLEYTTIKRFSKPGMEEVYDYRRNFE